MGKRFDLPFAAFFLTALFVESAHASTPETQCTTADGSWTISVGSPISVECPEGGECSALEYEIAPNAGRRATRATVLVEHDIEIVSPLPGQVSAPCVGDRQTRLGMNDCAHQAVKFAFERGSGPKTFEIVASGLRDVVESSIAVRGQLGIQGTWRGVEGCRIASFGSVAFHPNQQIVSSREITFKGCAATIPTDPITGEGGPATLTGNACVFVANAAPVNVGELKIGGQSVGLLSFGDAELTSSTSSCTTRVVNRRVYSWCACEDADENGIPDGACPPAAQ